MINKVKTNRFKIAIVAISISLLFVGIYCSMPKSDTLTIAVTILPQQEFVEQVCGEYHPQIMVLIPPGASPATYELTPKQMQMIGDADIYFKLGSGLPFENIWLDKIADLNPGMKIVDCSEGIEILTGMAEEHEIHAHDDAEENRGHHHHGADPHIWCSPLNVKIMVDNIATSLIELDPKHKEVYEKNAPIYKSRLDELDNEIKAKLAIISTHDFIIFHPAWGYFAHEYDLNQIPIEIEGKEPRADDLMKLVRLSKEKNIQTVFASPQFNTESAKMIAHEINGKVEFIDPLAKEYIANLREVSSKLVEAMR